MLNYKQRYKPRTQREYTKTDLTVYDSAGNTALAGLKVYGKSEVVDGEIKSAGEGWSVVDLGTLNWSTMASHEFYTNAISQAQIPEYNDITIVCGKLKPVTTQATTSHMQSKNVMLGHNTRIYVIDDDYTDATTFKTAMSGVLLCYQLADPSQGNAIAVKTDNGTGIGGTMATFTTGTPLYGIDENTRDVMEWNGTAGTVTKKYNKVRLADLTWQWTGSITNSRFYATLPVVGWADNEETKIAWICNNYTPTFYSDVFYHTSDKIIALNRTGVSVQLYDSSYDNLADFVASLGDAELIYELATPTTEALTTTENTSIASLRTFDGTTHFTNNGATDMAVGYTIKVPTIS